MNFEDTDVICVKNEYGIMRLHIMNKLDPDNIKKVIFNEPATIIIYKNGEKEVVKCSEGDLYNPEVGFAMAMMNIMFGSRSAYKRFINKHYKNINNKHK